MNGDGYAVRETAHPADNPGVAYEVLSGEPIRMRNYVPGRYQCQILTGIPFFDVIGSNLLCSL